MSAASSSVRESLYDKVRNQNNVGNITMPAVGKTLVFPREDNVFKKKESLPYDEI